MDRPSTSKGGSWDDSASQQPKKRLRNSKSTGLIRNIRRSLSLKDLRSGFRRTDDPEHPSLRAENPTSPNLALQSSRSFFPSRRHKGSRDAEPPVPPRPDPDIIELDTNLASMKGIVDHSRLHRCASSSSSGMHSSSGNSQSPVGSSVTFSDPFAYAGHSLSTHSSAPITRIESGDPNFPVPPSWLVNRPQSTHSEDDSSSDDGADAGSTSNVIILPVWRIRIYGSDNGHRIWNVSPSDTVADLIRQLDSTLPAGEELERHELYLKECGRERILRSKEQPTKILRRRLLQAGYEEGDGFDLLSGAGSFLLHFVYRSQFLGTTDDERTFTNFEYINLTGRSLETIPVALHQHAEAIISLHLSRNPMTDIPRDFVQSCTALSKLYLSHMSLKRVPQSVCDCAALTLLDLSSNRIATLDDAGFEALPFLTTLHVQNNRLQRLPASFPRLHRLTHLDISNNKFDTFPDSVTALPNLCHLDFSFNGTADLPREIGRLTTLERLVIVGNQLSALPDELRKLVRLRQLDCRRNQIVDLTVACGLPELATLTADHNSLHSHALSLGASLTMLDVSHNDITELSICRGAGMCNGPFALTSLDISHAKLSILDDDTLSQLLSLRTLKLNHNTVHTLPESLGDLKWLETLSCADNALEKLPQSIGKLQKLEFLDIHSNGLKVLPASLWNCASLLRLNATSNLLEVLEDPPPFVPADEPSLSSRKSVPSLTFPPRRPSVSKLPDIPPMAHSLEMLYLGENALTDEALHPLMMLKALRVLNLSFNEIQEMPSNFFRHLTDLEEVFLSGNRLTHIPSEDLPSLTRLSTLFLNGNHLQHLPTELGQVKSLALLDVGNNLLKYNINNLDYDWNWRVAPLTPHLNFNKNLMYLNLSGNTQLQIKSDVANYGQRPSTSSINRRSLSSFSGLTRLRVLGLMDVTITNTATSTSSDIPDESDDRRVRTSSSLINGMSYGIADTLGRNHYPHMMDLVHEFRGPKKHTVFAMFGRSQPAHQTVGTTSNSLAKFLKDHFIRVFSVELDALDPRRPEGVPDVLRRSFLKLNQDFHDRVFRSRRKMSVAGITDPTLLHTGASGIVVYIAGKKMYIANVGNALAVVSRGGAAHPVSRKHEPYDPAETARIRAAEGWISPPGLVNDELDISRSFGFYHLLPSIIARPDVCEYDLTDLDDMVVIANRGLWDYVDYQTAVDLVQETPTAEAAAQKLRDLAISYGAEGSTMVMVVRLANLTQFERRLGKRRVGVVDRTLDRLKDEVSPPVGHVAIVFTDIQGSTRIWEAAPWGMMTAIHLHNSLLRRWLRTCGGYEVRTEGDSFMCSFPTVLAAVWWCLTIQVALLKVSWPQDILECADGREVCDEQGRLIYGGLSVRIGIHCGAPLCVTDPVTNRMDYFGLMVTRAARIASTAAGGQIMFSSDVLSEINAQMFGGEATDYSDSQPKEAIDAIRQFHPIVVPKGEVRLKGLEVPETLSFILPAELIGRNGIASGIPTRTVSPTSQFNISQIRELAALCVRLEMTTADRVVRPQPKENSASIDSPILFSGDPSVLLPPNVDMSDSELATILYSLMVRLENVETVLRAKAQVMVSPSGAKNALVAALKGLDHQTLEEVLSMLHDS
ncbi:adenylate cyclase [Mycena maculata]|uniref:Adenylate cyclase n=1 Tax=Mycena maculata TaxID=230809 RepID=A0AAD7HLR5_9AGAR|nr:adenylate cyclase [Mycena maculata]